MSWAVLTMMLEVICLCCILNTCVNRVVGGFVAVTHQPAESNGRRQPVAAAGHLAEFHD